MYDALAHYYDAMHAGLREDIPLALDLARRSDGPILELGCGTGRLLLPLARAGQEIVGVDNSPEMLARARSLLAQEPAAVRARVTLVEGDILDLPEAVQDRAFGLVLLPYNTLLHFRAAAVVTIFRQVARLLGPEGLLLVDTLAPFGLDEGLDTAVPVLEAVLPDEESGAMLEQWSETRVDTAAQTMYVRWHFRQPDAPAADETVAMAYHYLYPHQLDLLLRQGGLVLTHMFGDYERTPLTEDSERLLVLAAAA